MTTDSIVIEPPRGLDDVLVLLVSRRAVAPRGCGEEGAGTEIVFLNAARG